MSILTRAKAVTSAEFYTFLDILIYFLCMLQNLFSYLLRTLPLSHVCFCDNMLHFSIILIPSICNHHAFCRQTPQIHQSGTDSCAVLGTAFIVVNLRSDRFWSMWPGCLLSDIKKRGFCNSIRAMEASSSPSLSLVLTQSQTDNRQVGHFLLILHLLN